MWSEGCINHWTHEQNHDKESVLPVCRQRTEIEDPAVFVGVAELEVGVHRLLPCIRVHLLKIHTLSFITVIGATYNNEHVSHAIGTAT